MSLLRNPSLGSATGVERDGFREALNPSYGLGLCAPFLHGVALDGAEDQVFDDPADHDHGQQSELNAAIARQQKFAKAGGS